MRKGKGESVKSTTSVVFDPDLPGFGLPEMGEIDTSYEYSTVVVEDDGSRSLYIDLGSKSARAEVVTMSRYVDSSIAQKDRKSTSA